LTDAAPGKLFPHAFAPDFIQLIQRDERISMFVCLNARCVQHARQDLTMVETNREISES
jgi:hypothetical protein